jgi:dTDP-glucose 4,6-dehydratase
MGRIIVTGGCGFIGSNFLNLYVPMFSNHSFLNVDCLTYAADQNNLKVSDYSNYIFSNTDITDVKMIDKIFEIYRPEWVVNFAAESHVDRSILFSDRCISTNVLGTKVLLDACKLTWKSMKDKSFLQVGTDEVFGESQPGEKFTEDTPYRPNTPYAASKASANHLARIYNKTYGLPVKITNCSNNYGPNQHVEKFFPRMMERMMNDETLTIHGDGSHTRDWLHVDDHCEAIWLALTQGIDGEAYNVGGNNEITILETIKLIAKYSAQELGVEESSLLDMIEFVGDRPANDKHYSIDSSKIQRELGWRSQVNIEDGFKRTVKHYIDKFRKTGI